VVLVSAADTVTIHGSSQWDTFSLSGMSECPVVLIEETTSSKIWFLSFDDHVFVQSEPARSGNELMTSH